MASVDLVANIKAAYLKVKLLLIENPMTQNDYLLKPNGNGIFNGACLIQPFLNRFSEGQLKAADAPLIGMVVQNCAPFKLLLSSLGNGPGS